MMTCELRTRRESDGSVRSGELAYASTHLSGIEEVAKPLAIPFNLLEQVLEQLLVLDSLPCGGEVVALDLIYRGVEGARGHLGRRYLGQGGR